MGPTKIPVAVKGRIESNALMFVLHRYCHFFGDFNVDFGTLSASVTKSEIRFGFGVWISIWGLVGIHAHACSRQSVAGTTPSDLSVGAEVSDSDNRARPAVRWIP